MIAAKLLGGPADGATYAVENGTTTIPLASFSGNYWEGAGPVVTRVDYVLNEETLKPCGCMPCMAVAKIDPKRVHWTGVFVWKGER